MSVHQPYRTASRRDQEILSFAFHNIALEGMVVPEETISAARDYLDGKRTIEDILTQMKERRVGH